MRVSELVEKSGVPLATVKYYLREGLLMPGTASSATQSTYGDEHVRRLALIRALTDVVGLPVQKAKVVLGLIDSPDPDLFFTLGCAVAALPPYDDRSTHAAEDFPRARHALEHLGQLYDPGYAAVAQFEQALAAAEAVGLPMSDVRLESYGRSVMQIAELDIDMAPTGSPGSVVEYSVLGTAIYEPVLAAMRRLAHQHIVARRFSGRPEGSP